MHTMEFSRDRIRGVERSSITRVGPGDLFSIYPLGADFTHDDHEISARREIVGLDGYLLIFHYAGYLKGGNSRGV